MSINQLLYILDKFFKINFSIPIGITMIKIVLGNLVMDKRLADIRVKFLKTDGVYGMAAPDSDEPPPTPKKANEGPARLKKGLKACK